ncbi:MAG: hypothetical protein ACT4OM_05995 [Actinomycetota bacterium]
MADEPAGPPPEVPDYTDRVDALLSSALADQAREKRQLVETLYGAKTALGRAEEQINALRDQVARRDAELLDALDQRISDLQDAMTIRLDERITEVEEALLKIAKSTAALSGKMRADLEVAAGVIAERMAEEIDNLLSINRQDAVEMMGSFGKVADRGRTQAQDAIEAAREEYRTTTEQLASYLGQRDDSLQHARDQVLVELFRQLGESLGKRNARKVAKGIADDPDFGRPPARATGGRKGRAQPQQTFSAPPPRQPAPQRSPVQISSMPESRSFSAERPGPFIPEPYDEPSQSFEGIEYRQIYVPDPEPAGPGPGSSPLTSAQLREYLTDSPPPFEPERSSATGDAAAALFGSMEAEDAPPKPRRRSRPPQAGPPKGPPKPQTSRRKP